MNNAKLAIKLNENPVAESCPLCGQETNPNIGAELMLADEDLVVCEDCGKLYAPVLQSLLKLGFFATDYHLCKQDYNDMWGATYYHLEQDFGVKWQAENLPNGNAVKRDWTGYEVLAEQISVLLNNPNIPDELHDLIVDYVHNLSNQTQIGISSPELLTTALPLMLTKTEDGSDNNNRQGLDWNVFDFPEKDAA